MRRYFFIVMALLLVSSCRHKGREVTRGIYYWKTNFRLSQYEKKTLRELHCNTMYLRCFDVDWKPEINMPAPVASVRLPKSVGNDYDYIPTVFITQRTISKLELNGIIPLAQNIDKLLHDICGNAGIEPKEIQIDCDWTAGTKNIYFALLKEIKQQPFFIDKTLSCTIRLHQVKYNVRNGIPPADKGLLMCYNMGDLKKPGAHNSILNATDAKAYTKYIQKYPLTLDIALPIFDWVLWFRGTQLKGILRDAQASGIEHIPAFRHTKGNLYECTTDTAYYGYELKKGDVLRAEAPSLTDILSVAAYTSERLPANNLNVVLFHCDSITLSKYSVDELDEIYARYH